MNINVFHFLLDRICSVLTEEARTIGFKKALVFEKRVREITRIEADKLDNDIAAQHGALAEYAQEFPLSITVDMNPPAQTFPDIVLGDVGIEVKFTEADTWRCIANSVLETNKAHSVKHICVV